MVKARRCKTPASILGSERARRRRCRALLLSERTEDPSESQEDRPEDPSEFHEADGATRPGCAARGKVAGGESGVELGKDGIDE